MRIHFLEGAKYLCGVTKPRNYATWMTFFRVAPEQRCPTCLALWRNRNGGSEAPAPVPPPFNYNAWALDLAAGLLEYDVQAINFSAVGLPNEAEGRRALRSVIARMRSEAKVLRSESG